MYIDSMTHDDRIDDELNDLNDLIRYLENEQAHLKKCVEKAAEEWEFSEAKAFAKAHRTVSGRLSALKSLRDPGYDKRAHYYRRLVFVEEQIKSHSDAPQLVKKFKEQLQEINQILDKLEQESFSPIDTQHIDDAIFELIDGTIESFKLHLNKSERLVFDFTCNDKLLQVGLSYKKRALFPSMKKKLRKIGFLKIEDSRRFVRGIDVRDLRDTQKIKQLLAVVVFDVFSRSWFDHPAELEINYRSGPHATNIPSKH